MIWEDPPPPPQGKPGWTKGFAAKCAEHPGKWARVVNPDGVEIFGSSMRVSLRKRGLEIRLTTLTDDGIRLPNGRFRIWARWPE